MITEGLSEIQETMRSRGNVKYQGICAKWALFDTIFLYIINIHIVKKERCSE